MAESSDNIMNETTNIGSVSKPFAQSLLELPKWKLALLGAVPVAAVGLGFWYFRSSKTGTCKKLKDGKKSASEAEVITPKTPFEKATAAKLKGNKYFKGGKYDLAINCYTEAISQCPPVHKDELSTFYQNRAAARDQLKQYEEVIEDCSKALEYNNKYIKALQRRAKCYEAIEKYMECLEDVTALCILENFGNYNSLQQADRVLKTMGKMKAKEAYKTRTPVIPSKQFIVTYFSAFRNDPIMALVKARYDVKEEKTEEEIIVDKPNGEVITEPEENEQTENIENAPEEDNSPFSEALKCIYEKKFNKISDLCVQELKDADSKWKPEALLLQGTFYQICGQIDNSIATLTKVIDTEGVSPSIASNALIKRGSLRMQSEVSSDAMKDFDKAIELDPENADIYHHRGQLNLLLEKIEDAVNDFRKSVDICPTFAVSYVQKCYTEYRQAFISQSPLMLQGVMKDFTEAIAKFPDCAEGMALYAQALGDQQQFEDAEKHFKKAVEIEPHNGNLYVHLGLLKLQWKSDIEAAVKLIKKALDIDDKCEFAYETLGTIEVQRGNLDKAVELFNKAISLARTEMELSHLYSLQDAAIAQSRVSVKFGITVPTAGMGPVPR